MDAVSLSDSFRASADVVFRELDGEAVLLDLARGTYFGLDTVGTRVWQLLGEHGRLELVLAAMLEEYDVEAPTLERDLLALVAELSVNGLLVAVP
jgi:hypothetical protein